MPADLPNSAPAVKSNRNERLSAVSFFDKRCQPRWHWVGGTFYARSRPRFAPSCLGGRTPRGHCFAATPTKTSKAVICHRQIWNLLARQFPSSPLGWTRCRLIRDQQNRGSAVQLQQKRGPLELGLRLLQARGSPPSRRTSKPWYRNPKVSKHESASSHPWRRSKPCEGAQPSLRLAPCHGHESITLIMFR